MVFEGAVDVVTRTNPNLKWIEVDITVAGGLAITLGGERIIEMSRRQFTKRGEGWQAKAPAPRILRGLVENRRTMQDLNTRPTPG